MAVKKTDKANVQEKADCLFSKEQLLASARFANRRDIVSAILQAGRQYSIAEVEQAIADYMKGKVR